MCVIVALFFTACVSFDLTEAGRTVDVMVKEEPPPTSRYIGDVEIGVSDWKPYSMTALKNVLRNRAAALGGDLLVIDTVLTNGGIYIGSGRVFKKNAR